MVRNRKSPNSSSLLGPRSFHEPPHLDQYSINTQHQEVQVSRCSNLCDDFQSFLIVTVQISNMEVSYTVAFFFHNATTWAKISSLCSVNFNIYVAFLHHLPTYIAYKMERKKH